MRNNQSDIIQAAAETLNLSDKASILKIKENYKELIYKWHPDQCKNHPDKCKEMAQKINLAYQTLIKYCTNYEISFYKKDIERTLLKDDTNWWYSRFGEDPIWGK